MESEITSKLFNNRNSLPKHKCIHEFISYASIFLSLNDAKPKNRTTFLVATPRSWAKTMFLSCFFPREGFTNSQIVTNTPPLKCLPIMEQISLNASIISSTPTQGHFPCGYSRKIDPNTCKFSQANPLTIKFFEMSLF